MSARILAAGAVVLAVAGCGSSPPSAVANLQRQAAHVCTRAQAQGARVMPPAVPAQTAAFLRRGIAVLRPELSARSSLPCARCADLPGHYGARAGIVST